MKFLTQDLHEDILDKLTQEQKDEIRDEFEVFIKEVVQQQGSY